MHARGVMPIGLLFLTGLQPMALQGGDSMRVEKWGCFELKAASATVPENPFDGAVFRARFGKFGSFRQKSVTRMNSITARRDRRANDRGYIQITFDRCGRSDANRAVGQARRHTVAIRF